MYALALAQAILFASASVLALGPPSEIDFMCAVNAKALSLASNLVPACQLASSCATHLRAGDVH